MDTRVRANGNESRLPLPISMYTYRYMYIYKHLYIYTYIQWFTEVFEQLLYRKLLSIYCMCYIKQVEI